MSLQEHPFFDRRSQLGVGVSQTLSLPSTLPEEGPESNATTAGAISIDVRESWPPLLPLKPLCGAF